MGWLFSGKKSGHSNIDPVACIDNDDFNGLVRWVKDNPTALRSTFENDLTLLHHAARKGDDNIVRVLLQHGADVRALEPSKDATPLHLACHCGHAAVVKALLEAGADCNACAANGVTPLQLAAGGGHVDVAISLIMAGADLNLGDEDGTTALHHAAYRGHERMVLLLLKTGANPNVWDGEATPLLFAKQQGHAAIAGLIQKYGGRETLEGAALLRWTMYRNRKNGAWYALLEKAAELGWIQNGQLGFVRALQGLDQRIVCDLYAGLVERQLHTNMDFVRDEFLFMYVKALRCLSQWCSDQNDYDADVAGFFNGEVNAAFAPPLMQLFQSVPVADKLGPTHLQWMIDHRAQVDRGEIDWGEELRDSLGITFQIAVHLGLRVLDVSK